MSFVLHVKATSLHIKYDSLSSSTFKLLYIILCGPRVVINIDVGQQNWTRWPPEGKHAHGRVSDPCRRSSSPPCPPPHLHFPPTRNYNWPARCFWRIISMQPNGPELRLKTPVTGQVAKVRKCVPILKWACSAEQRALVLQSQHTGSLK